MGKEELAKLHDVAHAAHQHVHVPPSKRDANTRNKERQVASKHGIEHANHMPSQLGQGGTVNNRAEKGSQVEELVVGSPHESCPSSS
jgi:hypothetical protein